jgi:glutamyl-Q tRNA(Asp) synthetase
VSVVTRFAPSPTGLLHLGHAWSALQAHDAARAAGGRFLVRIEDIDGDRSRPEYVQAILTDLDWLGLTPDAPPLFQSSRAAAYADALTRLDAMGLVYRCTCTRADLAAAASAPHGCLPPPYPGTCRGRYATDPDEPFAWRIDMARAVALAGPLTWQEGGERIAADPAAHGDVILSRKDALASYHLAATVDDAAQGVTHIIRGRDLLASTAVHRLLQTMLGLPEPAYQHHDLVAGPDGRRLAKRDSAATLAALRDGGVDGLVLSEMLRQRRFPVGFGLMTP